MAATGPAGVLTKVLSPRLAGIIAAVGLGKSAGLRTGTPLAVLQLRGRLLPWPWGWLIVAAAAAELVVDKLPATGGRTSPLGLVTRMGSAGWAGATVGGPIGAGVAAVAAVASAFAGMHTRALMVRRTGLPDGVFATAEDLLAVALAVGSTSISDPSYFWIWDWRDYPKFVPKPFGPFRLIVGTEYERARSLADRANRLIRRTLGSALRGKEIHEIHPVKFGGPPVALANKIPLWTRDHLKVTAWWNERQRRLAPGIMG